MRPRNLRRWITIAGIAVTLAVVASSPFWATRLGREIAWLEVRRVEVTGTHLLPPRDVLEASGVFGGQHILDDLEVWEAALLAHPVVRDARVRRRLPHTLVIRIDEEVPVALLDDGTLRFATSAGAVLPVDPFTVPLDLPIVRGSVADSASLASTRRLLAETERLSTLDPALMLAVSEVRADPAFPDAMVLDHHRGAEIIVPFGVSAPRLTELGQVLLDVDRRFPRPGSSGSRFHHRIDLRFSDQVVVRPSLPRDHS